MYIHVYVCSYELLCGRWQSSLRPGENSAFTTEPSPAPVVYFRSYSVTRLGLNLKSFCLSLQSAGIMGMILTILAVIQIKLPPPLLA